MFLKQIYTLGSVIGIEYDPVRVTGCHYWGGGEHVPGETDIDFIHAIVDPYYVARRETRGCVYILKGISGVYADAYKIGMTTQEIDKRLAPIGGYAKTKFERVWAIPCFGYMQCRSLERTLHLHFKDKAVGHEWFTLTDSDIDAIKSLPRGYSIDKSKGKAA